MGSVSQVLGVVKCGVCGFHGGGVFWLFTDSLVSLMKSGESSLLFQKKLLLATIYYAISFEDEMIIEYR